MSGLLIWLKHDRSDLFGLFINSYTGVFDPHTQYFAPRQKEQFEIELSGQLEGIGASLRQEGEFTEVVSYRYRKRMLAARRPRGRGQASKSSSRGCRRLKILLGWARLKLSARFVGKKAQK